MNDSVKQPEHRFISETAAEDVINRAFDRIESRFGRA
jgi:hypothetical protein